MPRRRVVFWSGAALVAAVVAAVVAYFVVLPWLVRREIVAALNAVGIADVHFDVRRATPWNLALANVKVGNAGWDSIAGIVASYSPGTLEDHRINELRLQG